MVLGRWRYAIEIKKVNKNETILFSTMEIAALSLCIICLCVPIENWAYRIVHWLLPNSILLIVFSFGKGILSRAFKQKVFSYMGDISFECFLIHDILIHQYVVNSGMNGGDILCRLFSVSYCLGGTVMAAALIHKSENR